MSVIEPSSTGEAVIPGATLRNQREQAGIALELVSQRTLIPLSRLQALENDDYERVGAATFVRGYVRAYAKFLGVDPIPLLRALDAVLPNPESVPMQVAPSVALALQVQKRPRSFFWPVVVVMVLILVAVAIIGLNTVLISDDKPAPAAPVGTERSTIAPQGNVGSLAAGVPALLAPTHESTEDVQPVGTGGAELTTAPLSAQTATAAERAETPAVTAEAVAEVAPDALALSFTEECWVEVTDASGKALIARLATSEDNLQLFGQAPFEVILGNAPVASVAFNGQAVSVPTRGRKFMRLTVGEQQ